MKNLVFFLTIVVFPHICTVHLYADIPSLTQSVIAESEEPYERRIYSYDIDVDSNGIAHVVYSLPVIGENRCEIIYQTSTGSKNTISSDGKLGSISTFVRVDDSGGVHIGYIEGQSTPNLYHYLVGSGPTKVDSGGWHSRMELDENNNAFFVRDNETWPALESKIALLLPNSTGTSWTKSYLDLPQVDNFRIASLAYDKDLKKYHITYGDDALLRTWAPSSNTYYSNFLYASSTDGISWTASTIDSTTTMWDMEWWPMLLLDNNGTPHASFMTINKNNDRNAALKYSKLLDDGTWDTYIATGGMTNTPAGTEYAVAAGMGAGFDKDSDNHFYGAWDNSPDYAINGYDGQYGNIIASYSEDGTIWTYEQQVTSFSAEGFCRVKVKNDKFHLLVLGDWHDTKLYYITFDTSDMTPALTRPSNLLYSNGTFSWTPSSGNDWNQLWIYQDGELVYSPAFSGTSYNQPDGILGEGSLSWAVQSWVGNESIYSEYSGITTGSIPVATIKANSSGSSISINSGEQLTNSISLSSGSFSGTNADWWLVVGTPSGGFEHYDLSTGGFVSGLLVTYQGALSDLSSYAVSIDTAGLATGAYTYYFGVDLNKNGSVDTDQLYYDSVVVNVQ